MDKIKRNTKYQQKGLVSILFILFMAIVASFILTIGYSRLLLALQRGRSVVDSLITSYRAESEINDLLARLIEGYLTQKDFDFSDSVTLADGTRVDSRGRISGAEQILTVSARRSFAVSEIQAVRTIKTQKTIKSVDVILILDCTSSMDERVTLPDGKISTIMAEQKKAALNFVESMILHEDRSLFRLGVVVFGSNAASWIYDAKNVAVTPDNGFSLEEVREAIDINFGNSREKSSVFYRPSRACQRVNDGTSIGSGFVFAQEYFDTKREEGRKQVEILITDGRPNSRIAYDKCPPSTTCGVLGPVSCTKPDYPEAHNFMRCALADSNTRWDGNYGVRNPQIDAYSVTIFETPSGEAVDIFQAYSKAYFNASRAHELTGILEKIFETIVESLSTISISRVIPVPEE